MKRNSPEKERARAGVGVILFGFSLLSLLGLLAKESFFWISFFYCLLSVGWTILSDYLEKKEKENKDNNKPSNASLLWNYIYLAVKLMLLICVYLVSHEIPAVFVTFMASIFASLVAACFQTLTK